MELEAQIQEETNLQQKVLLKLLFLKTLNSHLTISTESSAKMTIITTFTMRCANPSLTKFLMDLTDQSLRMDKRHRVRLTLC